MSALTAFERALLEGRAFVVFETCNGHERLHQDTLMVWLLNPYREGAD